jgi:phage terminase large subunit
MPQTIELPRYFRDLNRPLRHVAWYGGRGGGKSRTVAAVLILQTLRGHQRILCGRELQLSIRDSSKRLLEDVIASLNIGHAFVITEREIRGPHDSLFLFRGLRDNAAGIKSIEGISTFWGEEAQDFSQASLDTIVPTIRAPGSKMIWTWNPKLPSDPVDKLFRSDHGQPPGSVVRCINPEHNPWFPAELRRDMDYDRTRDIDKYNHVWRGHYRRNSEARVFRNWRVEAFDSPVNCEFRLGADFGFSIDPSCLVRCWIDGTRIHVDYEAWGKNVEIVNLPQLFRAIPDAELYPITADSARPETISHIRNHGFPRIIGALKGPRSVEEGVEFLKSYDIIVHPRCIHLIEELTLYSYQTDRLTGQVIGVLADNQNHVIDALRYAVEGARRALAGRKRVVSVEVPSIVNGFNR